MTRAHAFFLTTLLLALAGALWPGSASALDRTFAGSVQLDENVAPMEPSTNAGTQSFYGFTAELSGKVAVDLSDHISANVKICYGCHGFETDMAYFDLRVSDELNFRVGRFSPSFGAFNLRHDPANHKLADKPLPYDMGRMLRMRDWNLGVLPSPFPDNGAEVDGGHWFGDAVELEYAAYAVSGFKAAQGAIDLDFVQSHSGSLYYVDNNNLPAGGGRVAMTLKLGPSADLTYGASGMYGTYDPQNKLAYGIFGADAWLRIGRTNVRVEWLVRRQTFDTSNQTALKYTVPATGGDFFVKHGAYIEVEQPLGGGVDGILRVDGLLRLGNIAAGSPLSDQATVLRYTIGTSVVVARGVRLKLSPELYQFNYTDSAGRNLEVCLQTAVAGAF
ncbi:MAG TPA: hypothetical protein VGL81_34465 [Polyangiaceae bacterium]|jgi:hypothetical protein